MSVVFPPLTDEFRIRRLSPPEGQVKMVLDTDAFNEIDDQFAIVYSLLSPQAIDLLALYAAPFHNELSTGPADGMEKSYQEIQQILARLGPAYAKPVFRGATSYLPQAEQAVDSEAVQHLIQLARSMKGEAPLYVVAIGAITNIASALLLAPDIISNIVVVWLGGHALHEGDTKEFNLIQDVHATRVLLDSGVPLMLVPCRGVSSHLLTTLSEINSFVRGQGAIGDFLAERYESCRQDHFAASRVIWDISVIAWLVQPSAIPSYLIHSPILTDQVTWSQDASRHLIRYAHFARRDPIFKDLFTKLQLASK